MTDSTTPRKLAHDLIGQLLADREAAKETVKGRDFSIDQKIQLAQAASLICIDGRLGVLQEAVVTLIEAIESKPNKER